MLIEAIIEISVGKEQQLLNNHLDDEQEGYNLKCSPSLNMRVTG
jgi:hypothetical protein